MKDWIPVIVALIAAIAALTGYLINGRLNRINDKMRSYAEALAAVERYRRLPYALYRLHDSTAETRAELAKMIGEIQESLAFHRRWLDLDSAVVGSAYNKLVDKVRETNSTYRKQALDAPPPSADGDLEKFKEKFLTYSEAERTECMLAMRHQLKLVRRPMRVSPGKSSSWHLLRYDHMK